MAATTSFPHIIGFENRIVHRNFGRRKNPLAPQPFPKVGQQIKPRLEDENSALQERRLAIVDRRRLGLCRTHAQLGFL